MPYDEFTFDLPASALTDFTLMLDLSLCSASWWAAVDTSDGTKGRAFKQDGTTELAVDWIDFDDSAETGYARILWSGTLPTSGTIQLRISPPQAANASVAAADTYGQYAAYDDDWGAYVPNAAENDRTINGLVATLNGGLTAGTVSGPVGNATDFDGTDDYVNFDGKATDNSSNLTVMCLLQREDSTGEREHIINQDVPAGAYEWRLRSRVGFFEWRLATNIVSSHVPPASGTGWHFLAATINGGTTAHFRLDDSTDDVSATNASNDEAATLTVGADNSPGNFFNGQLCQVQAHSTARSDAWIAHEYDQTSDPATFWGAPTWVPGGADYTLEADPAAFTETGIAAGLFAGRQLPAAVATFSETGIAAGLTAARTVAIAAGVHTLTGEATALLANRSLAASAATFSQTGIAAELLAARLLTAATGGHVLAGIDAGLSYAGSYSLTASPAAFTETGIAAGLIVSRRTVADVTAYTLTGIAAGLTYAETKTLAAATGEFVLTGRVAGLEYSGGFVLTGITLGKLLEVSRPIKVKSVNRPITVLQTGE